MTKNIFFISAYRDVTCEPSKNPDFLILNKLDSDDRFKVYSTANKVLDSSCFKNIDFLTLGYKGDIQIGYDADFVIFDKDKIIDKSNFASPTAEPIGIEYVIVNGKIARTKNIIMNNRAGRIIRRQELKGWRDNLVR